MIAYDFAKRPDASEYLERCIKNGIVGRVFFTYSYAFAPVDAAVYATKHASQYCLAIIDHANKQIGDLPPYACNRSVHPDFLTCLATAAADSSLLMHFLIFVFAIILSKLAISATATTDSPIDTDNTFAKPTPTNTVSFKYVDVENPPDTPEKSTKSVKFIENYF